MRPRLGAPSSFTPTLLHRAQGISPRCFLSTSSAALSTSLYDVMMLQPSADASAIKQQFYKLSRRWHPDSSDPDASADRFKALSEAYSTLGDPEKRSSYDATLSGSSRPRRRHSSPRPTYSTSDDGSFGPRTTGTSAGSRAWQTDKHTRSAWQEAEAAARLRNRTARYAAGIGRTYHHPAADPVSDLERELARTAEYERRHRTLGRSMKGGVDESPFTGKRREEGADWTSTAPWVMTAVMMYGLLSWWMRRPVRMRGEEEAVQR